MEYIAAFVTVALMAALVACIVATVRENRP
jgi:hypothetical protein